MRVCVRVCVWLTNGPVWVSTIIWGKDKTLPCFKPLKMERERERDWERERLGERETGRERDWERDMQRLREGEDKKSFVHAYRVWKQLQHSSSPKVSVHVCLNVFVHLLRVCVCWSVVPGAYCVMMKVCV